MPRKLAADRYSPDTAAAFHHGVIARDATNRSDVVRAKRTAQVPRPSVPIVTTLTAISATVIGARGRGTPGPGRRRAAGRSGRARRTAGRAGTPPGTPAEAAPAHRCAAAPAPERAARAASRGCRRTPRGRAERA